MKWGGAEIGVDRGPCIVESRPKGRTYALVKVGRVEDGERRGLREAQFFLHKMRDQEVLAFGDKEPFDFYLSAFLGAGRTVDYRLRHEHGPTYRPWRATWDTTLAPEDAQLIKFLVDDRNLEVHESGSARDTGVEAIRVRGFYSDASGTLNVFSPPPALGYPATPAIIYRPTYSFTINGTERKATDACADYLALLTRTVTQFKADQLPPASATSELANRL